VRVLLVVNPNATKVTPERQRMVAAELGRDNELTVAVTTARDHATELAGDAVAAGVDAVVVLAGDGTLNEVVAALAGTDTVLACLPGGSTNVFSRTLGQPDDLAEATTLVNAALRARRDRQVGVGSVNGRHFLLHAGIGWDAALVEIVERHARWKPRVGHALFVYAGLRAFFGTYDRHRPHFSVHLTLDGVADAQVLPDGYFALVLNSDPYTYVHTRPFVVSPATSLDTPLTVVVCRSMRVARFLPLMTRALVGRRGLRSNRWLEVRTGLDELTIRRLPGVPAPTLPHQVDGDHLGDADELRFRHHPGALRILTP
jgi:diacylglycerol kinase family enzyme